MQNTHEARRKFIRHPAEIPIDISYSSNQTSLTRETHNISCGGLSFKTDQPVPLYQIIMLSIRITKPYFEEPAQVVWCKENPDGYEIGVEFMAEDAAFRAKMVEQVCHIEQYRKEREALDGKLLTSQEAALEWIDKFAADFSTSGD